MPRTPLFDFLQRSLAFARLSLRSERPVDEMLEEARERALNRRDFLSVSASAAAVLAYSGCAPARVATRSRHEESVVIVGAGIAGLTAAYRLKQAGIRARVLEAGSRVGGRMFSLRDHFADGQVAELGGELIDTGHTAIQALASELGIELDDLATDDPSLARDIWHFGGERRSEREVVEAFRPIAERIERDLETITGDDVTYREPNGAEALDAMTLEEWLERAQARGFVRDLLDVGYTTEYGLELGRQSALNLLLMIDPNPDPFRIYGESDERFHVRGGNDRIVAALASRLEGQIETGTALEAVRERSDGSFSCGMRRGAASSEIAADRLLLALPFTLLREVKMDVALPPAKARAIAEIGYGTNAKLMLGFSERVWRTRHGSNGSVLTDLPFQLSWETSRRQPGRSGILTNFTGGQHGVELGRGSAPEQAARLVSDLERIFPGVGAKRAGMKEARFHWPSHPWTKGSYACYLPGQWTGFRGAEGERVRRLHFAGEHCSLDAQGFMEGGCETGEEAAREIIAELGIPVTRAAPSAAAA